MRPMFSQQLYMFGLASREQSAFALGMTETLGPHSYATLEPVPDHRLGSNGTAVGSFERRIVDPGTGRDCAPGEVGALWLRGGSLMLGFHRRERSEVFDADGWYRTDDLCRIMDDGHLFFVGRANDMVKAGGANVSPDEVEKAMRDHPALREVSVLGLPRGEADELLVAAVVLREGHELDEETLRGWLKARLSSYKVPKRIAFLENGEIPLTAGAKVYKHGLRELLAKRLGLD
jgi:acyl-CoA synthetase (AMP-forming)/AMP-acid ligase II